MKILRNTLWTMTIILMVWSLSAFAQVAGDYRSVATGNWSDASTWETFDGANWVAAAAAPAGTETITVKGTDTVKVDIVVNITGYIKVEEDGEVKVTDGSLQFDNGGTYEHARDKGSLPIAIWAEGSTLLLTGITQNAPANRSQDFYHVTFNTPNLGRNRDMSWKGNTIGGDVRVISTGSNRWQMTSASGGDSASFTIMGDVIVEDGTFAVQGTGNALTKFTVHHYGDILVSGGNFSLARGSQGSGSGTTTWYLYEGDFKMLNASTQNSNPTDGNAKLIFAKNGTQQLTFDNVTYAGGKLHFEVSDTTMLQITNDFVANGYLVNHGAIEPLGALTMADGSLYEHARNGGAVPTAVWQEGSIALFTGITNTAPDNRGQDYYHLMLNTPNLSSNRDLSLNDHTIGGDLAIVSTGSARWQLVGGSSGTVTIMGDVMMQAGQFAPQGTSSATDVVIDHYGNIDITGGNFSIARGSQGSGAGTTVWNLHEGNFSMSNATTQNSNPTPGNAKFLFTRGGTQTLTLGEGNTITKLPIEVGGGTILDVGLSEIGGSDIFALNAGAALATSSPDGIDGNLKTTGTITLAKEAGFTYNGATPQVPGLMLPDSVAALTVANAQGVAFGDTTHTGGLFVTTGAKMQIDPLGSVTADSGTVAGTIVNQGALNANVYLGFEDGSVYEHARDGGDIPTGMWYEGSTLLMSGTVGSTPGNRNQSYYNIILNTPNMTSNRDMALDDVTIGGDIRVVDTGSARWRLSSVSAGDTAIITIMGDVIVEKGSFETHGTGNALTVFEVHHYGNVVVTGGNFSVSRGSQGSGSGSTRWYLHEGNFSMSDATTQNSNSKNAWFVFDKAGAQMLDLSGVTFGGGGLAIEVANGTTLDCGLSEIGGNGLFTLNEGATLATAHADGIAGAVQSTGTVTLNEAANYLFNGTAPQVTSALMPTTVNDLLINNQAGVALSQITTINGLLRLMAGEFDNTVPFRMGPNGSVSYEGGSLKILTSVEQAERTIPESFYVEQNYPNPFNPSTMIRFGLPAESHVTVQVFNMLGQEVATLFDGLKDAGVHELSFDAANLGADIYLYRVQAGDLVSIKRMVMLK